MLQLAAVVQNLIILRRWRLDRRAEKQVVMHVEIAKSGYPPHFFMVLGVWQVLAAIAISVPNNPRVKEWAYAGVLINLTAAGHHHYMAGDSIGKIAIPFVVLLFAIGSYAFRPVSRRLPGTVV